MLLNFFLELEGKPAGRFFKFAGGLAEADIVTESLGTTTHKRIASVKYQDMVLTCGTGMSRAFYEWIGDTFDRAYARKNGAVVAIDYSGKPAGRLEFQQALVTALDLPSLDRDGKGDAVMTVSISPEMTRTKPVEPGFKPGVYASALPKTWTIGDFRLKIDGLETDCLHVRRIDSIKLSRTIQQYYQGTSPNAEKEPVRAQYSDLVVRLPEMHATGFLKWLDDFVVKGNNMTQSEKKGVLEFFAPHSTKPYFGLELSGLGIMSVQGASTFPGKSSLLITVTMYCNGMKFYAGAGAII
jgi:hypothetical protein